MKVEFLVKVKTKVLPDKFRSKNGASYWGEINKGI